MSEWVLRQFLRAAVTVGLLRAFIISICIIPDLWNTLLSHIKWSSNKKTSSVNERGESIAQQIALYELVVRCFKLVSCKASDVGNNPGHSCWLTNLIIFNGSFYRHACLKGHWKHCGANEHFSSHVNLSVNIRGRPLNSVRLLFCKKLGEFASLKRFWTGMIKRAQKNVGWLTNSKLNVGWVILLFHIISLKINISQQRLPDSNKGDQSPPLKSAIHKSIVSTLTHKIRRHDFWSREIRPVPFSLYFLPIL